MESLQGKKVTVMGLGLHGGALGTIEWLVAQGADVTVTDIKSQEQLKPTLQKLIAYTAIRYVLGGHVIEDFTTADLVIRNPGAPRTSEFLVAARQAGVPVEMDSSLFFAACPSQDIIGVTGSKGKTTTANAIAILMKYLHPQTVGVGLDGVSPLGELKNILPTSPVIFELSSWRLEALDEKKISPRTAVVTSIYRDHLNTYASFEEYIETKKAMAKYQRVADVVILNGDDQMLRSWTDLPGRLYWYSTSVFDKGLGIFLRDGVIVVRDDAGEHSLFQAPELPLRSDHEQRNLLPALLIGYLRGMNAEELKQAISFVKPLPHRLETVATIHDVKYINDSAATMPDATIAALKALAGNTVVHILGGSDKALLFEELAEVESTADIKALVFLPGTATERMRQALQATMPDVPVSMADSMEAAVGQAKDLATSGDIVLLSPGATSFGLFLHEFDRGNKFRAAVQAL